MGSAMHRLMICTHQRWTRWSLGQEGGKIGGEAARPGKLDRAHCGGRAPVQCWTRWSQAVQTAPRPQTAPHLAPTKCTVATCGLGARAEWRGLIASRAQCIPPRPDDFHRPPGWSVSHGQRTRAERRHAPVGMRFSSAFVMRGMRVSSAFVMRGMRVSSAFVMWGMRVSSAFVMR